MGGKRLSKGNSIFFHLTIGLGVMGLLSSCQGLVRPKYVTDFQYLERIRSSISQEKFTVALTENETLERRYENSANGGDAYARVVFVSAQMNASLLKKVIQDEKELFKLSKKLEQLNVIIQKQNSEMGKLTLKQERMKALSKTVEDLEAENKTLRKQIKDFKKIDLEGDQINSGS